jgi:hypothetical protein
MQKPLILEQRGSHLLVRRGAQFAVVERRAGDIYSVRDGEREPHPNTPAGIAAAVGPDDWSDETGARRKFEELVQLGEQLAQRLR